MKKMIVLLMMAGFLGVNFQPVQAGELGVVNLYKIMEEYKKAQEITAAINAKKAELQQFQDQSNKKIKAVKSKLEKKSLFEKLNKEYNQKAMTLNQEIEAKLINLKNIQDKEVLKTVEKVARRKDLDLVLEKATVPYAKYDITDEVLKILNSSYKRK